MAIHFHEGLPGAGKSYEACVYHILPALKAGRQVITNIRGINWAKFAELLDEPEDYVRLLLIYVEPAEQDEGPEALQRVMNNFADNTPDNAMIVWDEIQDYFPSGNYKLPPNQQKFWTEHRHRGLEIVIMGQDRDDVHKIIRSRIEDIVYFLKLKAVGQPNRYKWEHWEKQAKGKFVKLGSGVRSYDSSYFGLYMSHRREGVKASVYQTKRSNVLKNSKALSLGVPLVFGVSLYAISFLWDFFHPTPAAPQAAVKVDRQADYQAPAFANPPPEVSPVAPVAQRHADQAGEQSPPVDYFDKLAQQHSVRVSALIDSKKPGKELLGYIELLDSSFHVKEKLSVAEIRALGWAVTRTGYGLLLEKDGVSYVARSWPIDVYGRVDNRTRDSLAGSSSGVPQSSGEQRPAGARVTVVNSGKPGHLW
ncbi:Zonular occludens toxin (Zot) [compost metagenome]